MSFAHKIRVGVLRGGPSPEYDVSLNTGKTVLANLTDEYEPIDIFVSKDGLWHTAGFKKDHYDILKSVDVIFNAMHGAYGEDGVVQKLLEKFGIPYTGSDPIASAIGMNKIMSKNIFNNCGLKTPHHIIIEKDDGEEITREMIDRINESLPFPVIIKPINSGSSLGVSVVENPGQIKQALENSFKHSPKLMAEEFIKGQEVACGVIEGFRGQNFYTLLPIGNPEPRLVWYEASFGNEENAQIQKSASLAHQALGLRHYSCSDFILHPKRGLFILETNSLPKLSHHSKFAKSLESLGGNIKEFLSHILAKTLGR